MNYSMTAENRGGSFIDPVDALNAPEIQELGELAVTKFRERSILYDPECKMPEANIQDLFERGWLTATISKKWGGKGSNLDTDDPASYLQAIRMTARGCGSTAHCLQANIHNNWILDVLGTDDQHERYIKPQMEKPVMVTGIGSEPNRRHMYIMTTKAKPLDDGGYIVNGVKNYATNAPMIIVAIAFASVEGIEHWADNHLMTLIEPGQEGVEIDHDWYRPMGMRSAVSSLVTLTNAHVPKENILGVPGIYPRQRWQGKYHLGFAANYLGVAEGVYQWFRDYIVKKGKAKDPIVLLRAGEMKIQLQNAESTFHDAIRSWKTKSVVESELLSMAAKFTTARAALDVCEKVTMASGSTALFDEFPLGRAIANVQTHIQHAGHDRTAQIIGQSELGEEFDSTMQR
ncbi:acyl-CoA dehydrogenase family protein [Oceanibacterium hippocampi]|uniref:Dibenzothiophene monooxygenase n=1 Tax=Oceanibacterium hippocampi TaxID=745714 RepID=A0A1Y5TU04_9PROT|nr:acyl-CoA dehydrogenase family protein [Oceanibacterium hippocampi]SLN72649.1 Dibenzothiophene desulfurization enzyme C [Oceanibacterium hippocampi]